MKNFNTHVPALVIVGFLLLAATAGARNFKVNCGGAGAEFKSINASIAHITAHPAVGTNVITVTGICNENVTIFALDNVTLQAGQAGASINDQSGGTADTLLVLDSQRFAISGFTINGGMSCANNAVCRTSFNTIQNSQLGYGIRYSRAHGDSISDVIQNNLGHGISVQNASRVILADTVLQANAVDGAHVTTGSYLILAGQQTTTTVTNNGNNGVLASDHATVRLEVANIIGNSNDGVRLLGNSVLRMEFASPAVNSITANGTAGVHAGDQSFAFFPGDGSANVTGNLGGTDVFCSGQFPATRGALTNIGGGTTNCTEPAPLLRQDKARPHQNAGTRGPQ